MTDHTAAMLPADTIGRLLGPRASILTRSRA